MIPTLFGKTFLQRALLALIAASLSACGGGDDDSGSGLRGGAASQQPPPAAGDEAWTIRRPTVPNQPPEVDGTPAAIATVRQACTSSKPISDDPDEDDFLEFLITNKPDWATLRYRDRHPERHAASRERR